MDDTELKIVVSAQNDSSTALESVSEELQGVGDAANAMAAEMDESAASVSEAYTEMGINIGASTARMDASIAELNEGMAMIDAQAAATADAFDMSMAEMDESIDILAAVLAELNVQMAETSATTAEGMDGIKSSALQAGIVAGVAFVGLKDEISSANDDSLKWGETINELNQELRNTGSSVPIADIVAYSSQLSQQTLFSQQAVLSAENEVMSYKTLQGQYEDITAAAADLATKTGSSLPQAMGVLTKALSDPLTGVRQLQSAHIALSATMVRTISDLAQGGATAAADSLLMEALKDQIGGLAETAAGASGSGMTKLMNDLQSMQVIIGQQLGPALDAIAVKIEPVVAQIAKWVQANPKLTDTILLGAAALAAFAVIVVGVVIAIGSVVAALGALGGSAAAIVIAAITAVGIGIAAIGYDIVTNWQLIKTTVEGVLNDLFAFFQDWYNKVMAFIDNIINSIKSVGSAIGGGIGGAVTGVENFVTTHLATGGIVSSPTVALIGEAGPEAVIPLSMLDGGDSIGGGGGGGGFGGGNIVVNITGTIQSTADQATQLANMIAKNIGRQLKLQSYR